NVYLNETVGDLERVNNPQILPGRSSPTIVATSQARALLNVAGRTRTIDETCVLVGGDPDLYLWLVRNLARLKTIHGIYDFRQIAVLIDDNLPQTHIDSLSELGIRRDRMIQCAEDEVLACRELIVPTPLNSVDVVHPQALNWLRANFVDPVRDRQLPRL